MDMERLEQVLARLSSAVSRIEAAAERRPEPLDDEIKEKYRTLKAAANDALREIDSLIWKFEG